MTEGNVIERKCSIRFLGISGSEANASASSLGDTLRDISPSVVVARDKDNPNTQDLGVVLNIVLGSTPAAAIAAGIAAWMRMHRVKVQVVTPDRTVEVSGDSADAAKIIESVFKK
jgi:hypothetical protein